MEVTHVVISLSWDANTVVVLHVRVWPTSRQEEEYVKNILVREDIWCLRTLVLDQWSKVPEIDSTSSDSVAIQEDTVSAVMPCTLPAGILR